MSYNRNVCRLQTEKIYVAIIADFVNHDKRAFKHNLLWPGVRAENKYTSTTSNNRFEEFKF